MPLCCLANKWVENLSLPHHLLGTRWPHSWWSSQTFTVRWASVGRGDGQAGRLTRKLDHHGGRSGEQGLGVLSNTRVRALLGGRHAADVEVVLAVLQGPPVEGPHVLGLRAGPGHAPQGEGRVEVHFDGAARAGGGVLEDGHAFWANCGGRSERNGAVERERGEERWAPLASCPPGWAPGNVWA